MNEYDVNYLNHLRQQHGRTKMRAKTAKFWLAVLDVLEHYGTSMTLRQLYYRLVAEGYTPKTERAYKSVSYHLVEMRRCEVVHYGQITDNSRWMRKPNSYNSIEDFLDYSQRTYRRDLWTHQDAYVEVWCESDSVAGMVYTVTEEWDTPLMACRGFPSETFVYEAAETLKGQSKDVYLYYLGDYDPSGEAIVNNTRAKLHEFGARFHFEQLAVTASQINEYRLPARPPKKSDSRTKNWIGEGTVELEAIPPDLLQVLVRDAIEQHIDPDRLAECRLTEKLERKTVEDFARVCRAGTRTWKKSGPKYLNESRASLMGMIRGFTEKSCARLSEPDTRKCPGGQQSVDGPDPELGQA